MADWELAYVLTFLGSAFLLAYIGSKFKFDVDVAIWVRTAGWGMSIVFYMFAIGFAMIPMGHLDVILEESSITNSSLTVDSVTSGAVLYSGFWTVWLVILVIIIIIVIYGQIFKQVKRRGDAEKDYE